MKNWSSIKVYLILSIGIIAGAQSGNLVRLGTASPFAIATYRLLLAGILMSLLAGRQLKQLAALTKGQWALLAASALGLGLHFITWITAVQNTTVANAAILFATNPIFTSIGAIFFFKEKFSRRAIVALLLGIAGTIVISMGDISIEQSHLYGDLMALICALFFTSYFLMGKSLRSHLDTTVYVAAIYLLAGIAGVILMAIIKVPFVGYDNQTYLCFLLMALIPTMIGHTGINYANGYMKASTVSIATLAEVPIAALVAAAAWGEKVTWAIGLGFILVTAAVVIIYTEKKA